MNAAADLSGQLLDAFEQEQAQAAAQARIKREPLSGRLHHQQPFGGGEASEMSIESLDPDQSSSIYGNVGYARTRQNMSQSSQMGSHEAWATHPSIATRASSVAFGAEQPDMKPLLGWYGEEAGEEGMKQLATMQSRLNQRLGPEYVSSRPGPSGGGKLHYLEGWKAIDLANDVFGFNGWSTNLVRLDTDFLDTSPDGTRVNVGVSAIMRVTLRDGTFHEDIGYGHIENAKGKAAALEKAKKEAVTDALKRSLRTFGRLVGNCMYDKKYLETVSKMSAPPPKYDVSQLHRRVEPTSVPAQAQPVPPARQAQPIIKPEMNADEASTSRHASDSYQTNGQDGDVNCGPRRSATTVPTNGHVSASEQERIRAERQALAAQRQAAFRQRQEEQQRFAAAATAKAAERQADQSDRQQIQAARESSSSSNAPQAQPRPPPQLRRAPPAAMPPSPPKRVGDTPAAKVYGKEPGARWASRQSQPPQVRPDTAQMMAGLDEAELSAAVAAFDASQPSPGRSPPQRQQNPSVAAVQAQAQQPRRSGSAGRFIDADVDGADSSVGGGVTSLSAVAAAGSGGGVKRSAGGGGDEREPLRTIYVDEDGSAKRQRR